MNIFSILMFLHKNLNFHQDFLPNFGFFCKFVKKYKLQFIYVLMSFLFVSSYVSICILLKFMYSKFQLSNSKIWLSYEYSNMPHLLVNTLYIYRYVMFLFIRVCFRDWRSVCFFQRVPYRNHCRRYMTRQEQTSIKYGSI